MKNILRADLKYTDIPFKPWKKDTLISDFAYFHRYKQFLEKNMAQKYDLDIYEYECQGPVPRAFFWPKSELINQISVPALCARSGMDFSQIRVI